MTRYNISVSTLLLLSISACSPNHRVKKGNAHLEAQRPDAAAVEFQRALDKDPSHVAALRGMAASHLSKKQPVRAILPAQRAAKSGDTEASRLLVRALLTTGRSEDARRTVEKSVEADPSDVGMQMLLVESLIANREVNQAAETADEKLIDVAAVDARSLHTWALVRANRMDDAVVMAAEATVIAPDNADIQAMAAMVFWKAKRKDDFNQAHKMARALLPASPRDGLRDATWLAEQGDTEGAIRKLATLHGAYPSHGKVAAQLGLLYAEREAWPDAARFLNQALASAPFKDQNAVSGVTMMTTGDQLKEGQRRSEIIDIATRLGDSYAAMGRHGDAAKAWDAAIAKNLKPTVNDHLAVATAWERAGNIDEMGKSAQRATTLDPASAPANFLLARAFDKSNNIEWAIRHGQKAWSLDPTQAAVALFLGSLYESRGERRVARELYRDALRRHPSDAVLYAAFERVGGTRRR